MRQRKAKDLDKRLQECSAYMIEKPQSADSRRGSECLREGKRSGAESSGADAAAHEHDPAMDYFGPDRGSSSPARRWTILKRISSR